MNVQFWFFIHRPLMISVPIISIASFIIILWGCNWSWIDNSEQLNFAHSIIGIITISFSVIQVIIFLLFKKYKHN
jgi:presenilin-like A22 family membrane protease